MEPDTPEPTFNEEFFFAHLIREDAFTIQGAILLFIILVLIICSALVSGSEIAFFSFKQDHLETFKLSKNKKKLKIYQLLKDPKRLLATILITNNFVNIGVIITSFYLLEKVFNFDQYPSWVELFVNSILVTSLIVLFGEVIPKVYATQKAEQLATFMAPLLLIAKNLLKPISNLLSRTSEQMETKWIQNDESVTADEMDMAIDITTRGKASDEEVQMLKSIVRFGDISVKDVMTSRPDVKALDSSISFKELLKAIRRIGFSRIPVYSENLDNIIGVLYIKDLLKYINEDHSFQWNTLLREPFFVPENKKIDDLLENFQSNRTHIAIVVDEYGGSAGLITLEDILEEIVGEIKDEFDGVSEEIHFEKIHENKFIFEGKVSLFDLCKLIHEDFNRFEQAKGESDSIAGLMLELAGQIPKKNQKVRFENFVFTAIETDQKRIKKVDVERF